MTVHAVDAGPVAYVPTKIKNRDELLASGDRASRQIVVDVADQTLARLNAYTQIRDLISLHGQTLTVGHRTWDLTFVRHIYLVGAGKACNAMALAVEHALGDRLTRGIAIVKVAEDSDDFVRTEVHVGGHPLPDEAGHQASQRILDLVDTCLPKDLFIAVVSGGSSALMNYPVASISVEDERRATDVLLRSGAKIHEINAVRRHISQTNGGRLAQRIRDRGAQLIGIGISDAVGNPPTRDVAEPVTTYSSTPIGPDRSTLDDARRTIADYHLADRLPASVVDFLASAGPQQETPKSQPGNTYFVLNTVADSVVTAASVAADMGITAHIVTSFLEGESREAGTFFAGLAREIQATGHPFPAPCLLIASGETTTVIGDDEKIEGHGGPSHELAAGFAIAAAAAPGSCALSIDTEGTDGTTSAAGGLCDSTSLARADARGVDLRAALRGHGTHEALLALDDVIITGNTGTNLCDLDLVYVPSLS